MATIDKSGGSVREMFRQIAPHYDKMNHLLSLNIDKRWRKKAVDRLELDRQDLPDGPLLDVCTGTGDLALALAKRAPDRKVIGSDFCHAMLEIAVNKNAKKNQSDERVQFIEADAQTLPFEDNTFATVTVAFGLRNVAKMEKGIAEMIRVCKPAGRVLVLEFSSPRFPVLKQGYQLYFNHVLPRIGQWFAKNDKSAYEYLPASVGQFPDYEELAQRLAAWGLRDVDYKPLTCGVATLYWGDK